MLSSACEMMVLEACAYRVARRIGSGATSSVFEAVLPDRRRFALKVLFAEEPELRVRFLLEAAALARIHHENVVPLLKLQRTSSGAPCIVMPLLVGATLRDHLATHGRLAPERASLLVGEALRGLDAAHRVGVVHRDVTPSNLFVGRSERESRRSVRAIVVDFGLAKLDDMAVRLPSSALATLDPTYLSPEVILGAPVDGRADVYSAGVVLFEAVAGRPPFVARDPARIMEGHLDREPPRLNDVSTANKHIADVVARALEKRPERRWRSALDFARALDAAIAV